MPPRRRTASAGRLVDGRDFGDVGARHARLHGAEADLEELASMTRTTRPSRLRDLSRTRSPTLGFVVASGLGGWLLRVRGFGGVLGDGGLELLGELAAQAGDAEAESRAIFCAIVLVVDRLDGVAELGFEVADQGFEFAFELAGARLLLGAAFLLRGAGARCSACARLLQALRARRWRR